MSREEIRRENARRLANGLGGKSAFARLLQMEASQVSQIIGPNPKKNIGNSIARRIEQAHHLPEGWLDVEHPELVAAKGEDQADVPLEDAPSTLGETIKSRLIELDKTQEWLAEETGVSKNAVSKWIKDGKISRANAVAAAKALGLTADQLLMGQPIVDASPSAETTLERLDAEEKRLLELYRRANRDGRLMIYGAATVAPKDSDSDTSITRPQ